MTSTTGESLAAAVRRTAGADPDRIAVVAGTVRCSYAQLDADSSALARHLRERGVRQGDVVAFSLPRGHDAVVAMLACVKARVAYLPLDPTLPVARRTFILEDAGPSFVITAASSYEQGGDAELVQSIPIGHAVRAGRQVDTALPDDPEAADAAYLLYTSGSTGTPKGVEVTHGNLAALLESTRDLLAEPADVWLCAHNFAFDFSVWEIWGALVRGGTVVIADQDQVRDPSRMMELVEQAGVSVVGQTPGAFYRLAELLVASQAAGRSRVRTVVLGGEALSWRRLERLLGGPGGPADMRLINMYGVTEGTVVTTARSVAVADLATVDEHSIGSPLPHMSCSVVDVDGNRVSEGEPGELVIGGPGVARGYVRGEVSEPRFFQDGRTGLHSFRTGDIVCWSAAGELLYHHRKDRQVQVRGHRVECIEVEHRLVADPRVSSAVVLLVDDELVAFIVGDVTPENRSSIVTGLRSHLPDYMVPTRVLKVDEIPLTDNGKVDHKSLVTDMVRRRSNPAAEVLSSPERAGSASYTECLPVVRQLWEVVLGHDDFDDDENFFEVGGHSFTIVALQGLLQSRGHHVALSDLFRYPTAAGLAAHLVALAGEPCDAGELSHAELPRNSPHRWRATDAFRRARPDSPLHRGW